VNIGYPSIINGYLPIADPLNERAHKLPPVLFL